MLRTLGPLGSRLRESGYRLLAPDGGRRLSRDEAVSVSNAVSGSYEELGLDVNNWFSDGRFWDADNHFDWLDSHTEEETGIKSYRAFENSIDVIKMATAGHDIHGIVGFSQGAVWGSVITALARRGELPFGNTLRFGIFMSGFLPVFDHPQVNLWPVEGDFHSIFLMGDEDPLFPEARNITESLAAQFPASHQEIIIAPGLGHEVTHDQSLVEKLVEFSKAQV